MEASRSRTCRPAGTRCGCGTSGARRWHASSWSGPPASAISRSSSTPGASAGSPTRTSTATTIQRMPHASGISPAPWRRGLAARIFFAATLLAPRRDYPAECDIALSRGALIARALSGEQADGAWLDDRAQRLYMAVAIPLRASPDAAPQGVLVSAYEVGDTLAQEIKQATGSDVVFFALDTLDHPHVVASTLPREDIGTVLAADTAALRRLQQDSGAVGLSAQVAGEHLVGLAGPIRSAGGSVYGGFVSFRSRDAELAAFRALQRTSVVAVGMGIVLALVIAFVLARQIADPVRRLALATRRVQDGDYSV